LLRFTTFFKRFLLSFCVSSSLWFDLRLPWGNRKNEGKEIKSFCPTQVSQQSRIFPAESTNYQPHKVFKKGQAASPEKGQFGGYELN
jgi:hypothetical protein